MKSVRCVAVYVGFTVLTAPKIDPANIYDAMQQSSILYDDTGNEIDSVNYGEDRTLITYDDIPETTVYAFVALEDKTFFKHHGFNWIRMGGAILSSLTGHGEISGTSTITQQLARNVYLPEIKSERSIRRKLIEMYYAARIEHALSKEEILAAYLNSLPRGGRRNSDECAAPALL